MQKIAKIFGFGLLCILHNGEATDNRKNQTNNFTSCRRLHHAHITNYCTIRTLPEYKICLLDLKLKNVFVLCMP